MEIIHIPIDAERIISTSSKGDQSKWRIGTSGANKMHEDMKDKQKYSPHLFSNAQRFQAQIMSSINHVRFN